MDLRVFYVAGRCQAPLIQSSLARTGRRADRPPQERSAQAAVVPARPEARTKPSAHAGPAVRHESMTQRSSSIRARAHSARLPETVQSPSGHECGGTLFVAVAQRPYANRTRRARETPPFATAGLRRFQDRALRHNARRHIPPQRNHQLAGHRNNADPPGAFAFPKIRVIPLRESAWRLPMDPAPGQLDADGLKPHIAGATDPLLSRRLPTGIRRRRNPEEAANLSPIPERPPDQALIEQYRGTGRRDALQPHQLPERARRGGSRDGGLLLGVELPNLRLEMLQTRVRSRQPRLHVDGEHCSGPIAHGRPPTAPLPRRQRRPQPRI
jgi:hypothetical protein